MSDASRTHIQIRSESGWVGLHWGEFWEFRDVLIVLALRDVRLRYRQTALGVVWVVLQPLLAGLIFSVVFGRFAKLPSGGRPYLLFVFAGLLGWNLFAGILQRASNSLVAESRLISKVYFPRLLIPCASAAAALVDFGVSLVAMVALMIWYGVWPGVNLLLLPMAVVLTVVFALGVSFWVSALNVRYRDFTYALPFLIQVLMYASPVVYGLELVPERWRGLFAVNPLVGVMQVFRSALLGLEVGSPLVFVPVLVLAGVTLVSGAYFFRRVEGEFADNL